MITFDWIWPGITWKLYTQKIDCFQGKIKSNEVFPGGSIGRNPPANAGDIGLIPNLGRCHMPWRKQVCDHNYWTYALEPESRNYWAHMPLLLKAVCLRDRALQQERPLQWEACAPQPEHCPCSLQLEKSPPSNKDPAQPKWIKKNFLSNA